MYIQTVLLEYRSLRKIYQNYFFFWKTSVDCRKKMIAMDDSTSRYDDEMVFSKGDEMILEEERTEEGWLFCLNQTRNTRGWVHETSLINIEDHQ